MSINFCIYAEIWQICDLPQLQETIKLMPSPLGAKYSRKQPANDRNALAARRAILLAAILQTEHLQRR